jgi:two-component system, NtrC family, response regulator AlgB
LETLGGDGLKLEKLPRMNILLIDDEQSMRKSLRLALETMDHRVTEAHNSAQALDAIAHRSFEIALLDLQLGQERGLDVLPTLLKMVPGLAIVVITAYATIETAVESRRLGAIDYLPKPFTPEQIRIVLDRVVQLRRLQLHVEELEEEV